jgi:Flp pilus assembly protein TadG
MPTRLHSQRGQSLVETMLMMVMVFTVVLWIFELGWLMYTYSVMADAANEGVRHAIVHSGGDPTGTKTIVNNFATTSLQQNAGSVCGASCVTFPDGSAAPPNRVRVTVTYTFIPWLSRFFPNTAMSTYAEGRMVIP